jgi:hypothetical protein
MIFDSKYLEKLGELHDKILCIQREYESVLAAARLYIEKEHPLQIVEHCHYRLKKGSVIQMFGSSDLLSYPFIGSNEVWYSHDGKANGGDRQLDVLHEEHIPSLIANAPLEDNEL